MPDKKRFNIFEINKIKFYRILFKSPSKKISIHIKQQENSKSIQILYKITVFLFIKPKFIFLNQKFKQL